HGLRPSLHAVAGRHALRANAVEHPDDDPRAGLAVLARLPLRARSRGRVAEDRLGVRARVEAPHPAAGVRCAAEALTGRVEVLAAVLRRGAAPRHISPTRTAAPQPSRPPPRRGPPPGRPGGLPAPGGAARRDNGERRDSAAREPPPAACRAVLPRFG